MEAAVFPPASSGGTKVISRGLVSNGYTMGPGEVDPVGRCGRCGKKYRQRDKPQMKGRFFHRQVSVRDQTLIIDYVCR
jgi:hypothetical protein